MAAYAAQSACGCKLVDKQEKNSTAALLKNSKILNTSAVQCDIILLNIRNTEIYRSCSAVVESRKNIMKTNSIFENFDKQTQSTYLPNYSESAALTDLLRCINSEAEEQNYRLEFDETADVYSQFTITVAGRSIAFLAGGPQIEALYKFVEHIAEENLYNVDYEKMIVE